MGYVCKINYTSLQEIITVGCLAFIDSTFELCAQHQTTHKPAKLFLDLKSSHCPFSQGDKSTSQIKDDLIND